MNAADQVAKYRLIRYKISYDQLKAAGVIRMG